MGREFPYGPPRHVIRTSESLAPASIFNSNKKPRPTAAPDGGVRGRGLRAGVVRERNFLSQPHRRRGPASRGAPSVVVPRLRRLIAPADRRQALRGRVGVEGRDEDLLHLRLVDGAVAGGGRCRGVAPDVRHALGDAGADEGRVDTRLHVAPVAHVLRLLLDPDDLGVGVPPGRVLDAVEGEGADLLHRHEGDALLALLAAVLEQVVVDLARAQDDAADLLAGLELLLEALRDDALEALVLVEALEARHALRTRAR
mmetsp:Transcript_30257/g.80096  ORF Transcript_30257/g.80096 Transcript_30257/m.80096 type:complete len:256 (+) Transcript_30257:113-880(+)